jgi:hypothetical protein
VGGLQAQLDAMGAVLDEALRSQVALPAPTCPHLETENVGTFGSPELRCTACLAVVP